MQNIILISTNVCLINTVINYIAIFLLFDSLLFNEKIFREDDRYSTA